MSKSLRSMSEFERKAAIARRLASNTKGLGYWAAVDAQARLTKRAADGGDSAAFQALSAPEHCHVGEAGTTPPAAR